MTELNYLSQAFVDFLNSLRFSSEQAHDKVVVKLNCLNEFTKISGCFAADDR